MPGHFCFLCPASGGVSYAVVVRGKEAFAREPEDAMQAPGTIFEEGRLSMFFGVP